MRLDRYQLQSLKPDLHESIQMTPVQAPGTKRLVLEPMAPISSNLNSLEKELGENLNRAEQPVCKGMVLSLKIKDFARKIRFGNFCGPRAVGRQSGDEGIAAHEPIAAGS